MRISWRWCLGILLASTSGPAAAAPVETVLGVDLTRGPEERVARTAFAGLGVGLGPHAAVSLALAGSDDSEVGRTSALVAGKALAFLRVLAGPEFGAAAATRLGLFYVFESNDAGDRSDGARVELALPVGARWTGRVNAAWATVPRAVDALSATLGASFAPARLLELVGELGVARGTALSTQGPLDRFLGDPPPEVAGTTTKATPIALVGLRVTLP